MTRSPAATPSLAALRQVRAQHEAVERFLHAVGPPLVICLFTVSAFVAKPRPGLTGRPLATSFALGAFIVAVAGSRLTFRRRGYGPADLSARPGGLHTVFGSALAVSSVLMMWAQPAGPGPQGMLIALLFFAPLLPQIVALPATVFAFAILEAVSAITSRTITGPALLAVFGGFLVMMFLANRLNEANAQAETLLVELEQSRAAEAAAAGLAERQRLAREMHDVLAHSLSGLLLQLEGARMLAAENPQDVRLPKAIDRAHHLARSGLDEARRAIGMLRDDELPGPERLAGLVQQFEADRGIPCRLTVDGCAHPLGSEARLALYRVAQEALTNITKHARPERVELHLAYEPSAVHLTIEDFTTTATNGTRSARPDGGGYGLTGMRERAELLGGTLTAMATRNGFRVALDVPA